VSTIRDKYGSYELPQILKALGEGNTMAEALRKVLRMDYSGLETELGGYVAQVK
jgi:hypothetical protein